MGYGYTISNIFKSWSFTKSAPFHQNSISTAFSCDSATSLGDFADAMASSAFKSTTRRAPIGNSSSSTDDSPSSSSSSSKPHRRSRSLSRFSRPIRTEHEPDIIPTPRRKFVNAERGSSFSGISLDDLALEFFPVKDSSSGADDDRGSSRSGRITSRNSDITNAKTSSQRRSRAASRRNIAATAGGASGTASSQRARGRSVSRHNDGTAVITSGTNRAFPEANSRRRRSVSVARYHISDSEGDMDHSRNFNTQSKLKDTSTGNSQIASFQKPTASSHQRSARSMSQKPLLRSHSGYSSRSPTLNDDELRDVHFGKCEIKKTIQAIYAQKKIDHRDDMNHELYEELRKELRSAVIKILIELEQARGRKPSVSEVYNCLHLDKFDAFQMDSAIRKKFAKLEQKPEEHKQYVSAELALEDQQDKGGSKIVKEVLPDSKSNVISLSRKRSNDGNRTSKQLTVEAEKYLDDFISNVEDTDFSSFEEERSDTSSSLGGTTNRVDGSLSSQTGSPAVCNSLPIEREGINLPWLKWDSSDVSPLTSQNTPQPHQNLHRATQDSSLVQRTSSHENWYPELADGYSTNRGGKLREAKSNPRSGFDMGRYAELQRNEQLLFEKFREQKWIGSGGLLLCGNML